MFYDLRRIWPANINVDSTAFVVYHPLAKHQAFLFDKSTNANE